MYESITNLCPNIINADAGIIESGLKSDHYKVSVIILIDMQIPGF